LYTFHSWHFLSIMCRAAARCNSFRRGAKGFGSQPFSEGRNSLDFGSWFEYTMFYCYTVWTLCQIETCLWVRIWGPLGTTEDCIFGPFNYHVSWLCLMKDLTTIIMNFWLLTHPRIYLLLGLSENRAPQKINWLIISFPSKWLFGDIPHFARQPPNPLFIGEIGSDRQFLMLISTVSCHFLWWKRNFWWVYPILAAEVSTRSHQIPWNRIKFHWIPWNPN